jgi:hypothetical protein
VEARPPAVPGSQKLQEQVLLHYQKIPYHHPNDQIEVVQPFFAIDNCCVPLVKDADSGNHLRHRSRDIFIDLTPTFVFGPESLALAGEAVLEDHHWSF